MRFMKRAIMTFFFALSLFASGQQQKSVKASEFLKDKKIPTIHEIFDEIAYFRDSLGLSGIVLDSNLCKAAKLHADWMAVTGNYSHVQDRAALPGTPLLSEPWDRGEYVGAEVVAENMHTGWKYLQANLIVYGWFTSKDHRRQMLRTPPSGELLKIGIAIKPYDANPNYLVAVLVFGPSTD